jgi:hypothetical protein
MAQREYPLNDSRNVAPREREEYTEHSVISSPLLRVSVPPWFSSTFGKKPLMGA